MSGHRARSASISITLETILSPALAKLRAGGGPEIKAFQILHDAFSEFETKSPGISHDFVAAVLDTEQVPFRTLKLKKSTNPVGTFSRESGAAASHAGPAGAGSVPTALSPQEIGKLEQLTGNLTSVLNDVPQHIGPEGDRLKFMNTVKQSAAAIKNLLDCLNLISRSGPDKAFVFEYKNEFVKVSKSFSDTLKLFFKKGDPDTVVASSKILSNACSKMLQQLKDAK